MRYERKKGISLIVLVITIIIIVILAVSVILSIAKNNPIGNARKARDKNDIAQLTEYLSLGLSNIAMDRALTNRKLEIDDSYPTELEKEIKELDIDTIGEDYVIVKLYNKKFLISEFAVINYLSSDDDIKVDVYKNNVAEMIEDESLTEGKIVNTLGYYSSGDGGNSIYTIVNSDEPDVQGEIILLDNGNKAKLNIINKTLDVKQFGALGDGVTDESTLLQYTFDYLKTDKVDTISLAKGTYVVNKRMVLNSGNYEGKEGSKIKITLLDNAWCFRNENALWTVGGDAGKLDTISINNIDFSYINNIPEQVNVNMKMIRFDNTINSKITNCNFYTEEGNYNGVCALDMYCNNSDLLIDKCNFNLRSTNMNEESNRPLTTDICVREYREHLTSKNIKITNCVMRKNGWDETLWLDAWSGTLKDVLVDNCQIIDEGIAITTFWVGATKATGVADNITIKNTTISKELFSYRLANIGSIENNTAGTTKNINFENNTINIKSLKKNKALSGGSIFSNSYGNTTTENIVYDNITINSDVDLLDEWNSFTLFADYGNSTRCKNIHLNIKEANYVFMDVNEVDTVDSNIELNAHLLRGAKTIKNINLNLASGKNFINDFGYKYEDMNISDCNVACNIFVNATITDSNPNYFTVNATNCNIKNAGNLVGIWLQDGQSTTTESVKANFTKCDVKNKNTYSRFGKVSTTFNDSTLNGNPI